MARSAPKAPILRVGSPASPAGGKDTVTLDDAVFGAEYNGALVHEVVIAEQAARRAGTQHTKTRGQVRGGGAKPWRQKGTGRARAGSSRSPLWAGGGHTFALAGRRYTVKVNRKARRAALRSVLSAHAGRGSIAVLDAANLAEPSTKRAAELLAERLGGSVLVVLAPDQDSAAKSFRNLARVTVCPADNCGVVDLAAAANVVMSREAVDQLTDLARKPAKRETAEETA